jgi:RHS repeat-associated protein
MARRSKYFDEAGHILGEYTAAGALIQETIWMGDTPVATLQPSGSSVSIYYVHADHLGTPRKVTRPSDNGLMWRWDPDTFGSVSPNTNPSGLGVFNYNLRFPGQYSLNESGLYYNYFRTYDPNMGRYLESDPIGLRGGSLSTYAYVGGNPVVYVDPFGLCWVYIQSTGQLTYVDVYGISTNMGTGYAGYGAGLNNPAMQSIGGEPPNPAGPLPQGGYTIATQQDNVTGLGKKLTASMRLTPNGANQMFKRAGLLIHGPHANDKHDSSNGCPIFNRSIRDQIGNSGDNCFQVVP